MFDRDMAGLRRVYGRGREGWMPIGSTLVCPNISCPWQDPHDEISLVYLSSAKAVHSKIDEFSGDFQIGWG